jgi:hypothetical protein
MTYAVGNPGSGLGQAQYCGGVKLNKRIPTPIGNRISNSNTDLLTNDKKNL